MPPSASIAILCHPRRTTSSRLSICGSNASIKHKAPPPLERSGFDRQHRRLAPPGGRPGRSSWLSPSECPHTSVYDQYTAIRSADSRQRKLALASSLGKHGADNVLSIRKHRRGWDPRKVAAHPSRSLILGRCAFRMDRQWLLARSSAGSLLNG
jgi:hypothetical protein